MNSQNLNEWIKKLVFNLRAVDYLESVTISEETETMWKTLAKIALESRQYYIAER